MTFAHLIGNVGASSVGRDDGSKMMWMSIDDPGAFKSANPKSTVRGVNANPKLDNWVFGTGVKGTGYYHLHTREAYDVILNRIETKCKKVQNIADGTICCIILIVFAPCGLAIRKKCKE